MLIIFKGKGRSNCPFYHMWWDKGEQGNECILHKYTDEVNELCGSSTLEKPDGCPFKGWPGNLEIQADESEET